MSAQTDVVSTRQRILNHAARLFAEKGFTETTVRELAEAVGINAASLYNHFASKNAILENILADYSKLSTDSFNRRDVRGILQANPNTEGILTCLQLNFPQEQADYLLRTLCVLLQEQFRNTTVRDYMSQHFILRAELNCRTIISTLIELGVLRADTDPDYWMKVSSSLFYAFSVRFMLGIGDNAPDYVGRDMSAMLRSTYELLLQTCAVNTLA